MEESILRFVQEDTVRQLVEETDREVLESLFESMTTEEQRSLIGFFCAIGPAASAVLEDMALEGRVWPGCEPYKEPRKQLKFPRSKLRHRRSHRR